MNGLSYSVQTNWMIHLRPVYRPRIAVNTYKYTGMPITPEWLDYDPGAIVMSGDLCATRVGEYRTVFTLKPYHCWSDGSTDPYVVDWSITAVSVSVPVQVGQLWYSGEILEPIWSCYNPAQFEITGDVSDINAGVYDVVFTLREGYEWADGTTEPKMGQWKINKMVIPDPQFKEGFYVEYGDVLGTRDAIWWGADTWRYEDLVCHEELSTDQVGAHSVRLRVADTVNYTFYAGEYFSLDYNVFPLVISQVPAQVDKLEYLYGSDCLPVEWDCVDLSFDGLATIIDGHIHYGMQVLTAYLDGKPLDGNCYRGEPLSAGRHTVEWRLTSPSDILWWDSTTSHKQGVLEISPTELVCSWKKCRNDSYVDPTPTDMYFSQADFYLSVAQAQDPTLSIPGSLLKEWKYVADEGIKVEFGEFITGSGMLPVTIDTSEVDVGKRCTVIVSLDNPDFHAEEMSLSFIVER